MPKHFHYDYGNSRLNNEVWTVRTSDSSSINWEYSVIRYTILPNPRAQWLQFFRQKTVILYAVSLKKLAHIMNKLHINGDSIDKIKPVFPF